MAYEKNGSQSAQYPFLTRLYYACSGESMHWLPGLNLSELYRRLPETESTYQQALNRLNNLPGDQKTLDQTKTGFDSACAQYELQGFVNGFCIGLTLAKEAADSRNSAASRNE